MSKDRLSCFQFIDLIKDPKRLAVLLGLIASGCQTAPSMNGEADLRQDQFLQINGAYRLETVFAAGKFDLTITWNENQPAQRYELTMDPLYVNREIIDEIAYGKFTIIQFDIYRHPLITHVITPEGITETIHPLSKPEAPPAPPAEQWRVEGTRSLFRF